MKIKGIKLDKNNLFWFIFPENSTESYLKDSKKKAYTFFL